MDEKEITVRASVRSAHAGVGELCSDIHVAGDINGQTDWRTALNSIDFVVHCAARVHVMSGSVDDDFFDEVNLHGCLNLARQAASFGVRRFIFISSIKVNGECTGRDFRFCSDSPPSPNDAYARSKLRAELGLRELSMETGMEVVIIRPPLVYGPGVGANFFTMMNWLRRGVPLPLANIDNRRSLVSVGNLVDLIITCIDHPAAAGEIFLVSDDDDMSTSTLLKRLGVALGRPARLFPVPVALLAVGAGFLGKSGTAQRLCGSLQADIERTKKILSWSPPHTVQSALGETAKYFLEHQVS